MANIGNGAIEGADLQQVVSVSANYTVQPSDQFVQVTTGTSVIVVTLPAPTPAGSFNPATQRPDQSTVGQTGNVGVNVTIQKIDAAGNGTTTGLVIIAGTLNIGATYGLKNRWSQAQFMSDGTTWQLVGTVS
jgi:hypothetical protein